MKIAIIGGGISGLTAAYEFELARKRGADIDWHLYESSDRLGGTIETTRKDGFILEGGPDGWVTEKPWARDLAIELGLEDQLIYSNDATRKTYIYLEGALQPIPDRMRLMVPEDLSTLEGSPLFSASAKQAYAAELTRADELRATAPNHDESVATFVRRHFGDEVLNTLAAPLLSGVFGGDVHKLSVRAVMPQFVAMEREHGSLIAGLQAKAASRVDPQRPIFTSLRNGMASLVDAITAKLPPDRVHFRHEVQALPDDGEDLFLEYTDTEASSKARVTDFFDHIVFAVPIHVVRRLGITVVDEVLKSPDGPFVRLGPVDASSAILAAFTWAESPANSFTIPPGFGFLVPPTNLSSLPDPEHVEEEVEKPASPPQRYEPQLLACTFVDQKFAHRAPPDARILRAFFGGASAAALAAASDEIVAQTALNQLRNIFGPIPEPTHTEVRRWPRSLPQYEVGHLDRIDELDFQLSRIGRLTLLGNAYRGVGLPDLIRDARTAARALTS